MTAATLKGRHALVTGGGRGIGRAIAQALTVAGADVTVLGRTRAGLDATVRAGDAKRCVVADVTNPEALAAAIAEACHAAGPIAILVANAGGSGAQPFAKTTPAVFRDTLDLNLMGVVHAAHAVLPEMLAAQSGRIIAVASTAALKGYPYVTAYVAAKHAVLGLVRALAAETALSGVTVNAVCPGFTATDMTAASLQRIVAKTGRTHEAALAELTKHNPQGRLVEAREVADAVVWLAGDGAAAITGQAIAVAGGEV